MEYTPIVGVSDCSMFCCSLLYVHSCFAIILMGKREFVALLGLSSWCLVIVVWLFVAVPLVCLRFVIFPDHTHLLFLSVLDDCSYLSKQFCGYFDTHFSDISNKTSVKLVKFL